MVTIQGEFRFLVKDITTYFPIRYPYLNKDTRKFCFDLMFKIDDMIAALLSKRQVITKPQLHVLIFEAIRWCFPLKSQPKTDSFRTFDIIFPNTQFSWMLFLNVFRFTI